MPSDQCCHIDFQNDPFYMENMTEPHCEKTGIPICENKIADQLRSNCASDKHPFFR